MRWSIHGLISLLILFLGGVSCSGGSGETCDPVAQTGCGAGQVCEAVQGGSFACFDPILIRGMVFDLATDAPIEGARVVALDANRAPISTVAITDINGNYDLAVSSTRDTSGNPIDKITLRADARGYQTFPSGVRVALPIDLSTATLQTATFFLQNSLTDIGMNALPGGSGTASIHGVVDPPPETRGALVVAESAPDTGFSGIADTDGNYAIFNLAPGDYSVKAYAQGANYNSAQINLGAGQDAVVNLSLSGNATVTLNGKVEIVNPGDGQGTSIILVVESTFNENLARGETPPGLRAPDGGQEPNVTGDFTIEGVPEGRYVVLAAFENDFLVRDPDTCISGTDIVHITVGTGGTMDSAESFKVTGALDVISPGALEPEAVGPNPDLIWEDDSSEDFYRLKVFDTFGNLIFEDNNVPLETSMNPSVPYAGPPLESGMFYQFRATSVRVTGGGTNQCEISQTEDLKGVFFLP